MQKSANMYYKMVIISVMYFSGTIVTFYSLFTFFHVYK